ncbi:MAG: copper chaperone [Candelina mexicana]|nr:MAG: copper chaperone [Candelina mexicana]
MVRDKVRGLARIVQVSPNLSLVDLTIRGLSSGTYWVTVRQTGDISQGAASTGGIWKLPTSKSGGSTALKGVFGTIEVGQNGIGSVFLDRPIQIWEIIGRSMVISKQREGSYSKEDPHTLVGVIARSAGIWDNDKTVCSCSGKTVWEERKEQVDRGML